MPPKLPQAARKITGGMRLRESIRGREPQRQPATKVADPTSTITPRREPRQPATTAANSKPAKMARKPSGSRAPQAAIGGQDPGLQTSTKATHPAYWTMVKEAISSLKQRRGSSEQALAKYLEKKYGEGLPENFRKTLSKRLMEWSKGNGPLTKVKNSFKLK